jgi:hypothetical protein
VAGLIVAAMTFAAAAAAWAGFAWLVLTVPPARPLAVVAAYVFAFVGITATGALAVWLAIRPRQDDGRLKSPAGYLAHSMLLAMIVLFALWLQGLRTLTPIALVLLIGLYAVLELAILFGTRGSVELPVPRQDRY